MPEDVESSRTTMLYRSDIKLNVGRDLGKNLIWQHKPLNCLGQLAYKEEVEYEPQDGSSIGSPVIERIHRYLGSCRWRITLQGKVRGLSWCEW